MCKINEVNHSSSEDEEKEGKNKIINNASKNTKKCYSDSSDSYISDEDNKENIKDEKRINEVKINENEIYKDQIEDIEISFTPRTIERGLIESIQRKENVSKKNLNLAEKIDFKKNPDKIIDTDEFGFLKINKETDDIKKPQYSYKKDLLTINARTEKWKYMIDHLEEYKLKKKKKLKKRTRKGIPDSLRSYIWQLFAGIDKYVQKDLFENLDKEKLDQETEITIIKDLDRTFPKCQMFRDKYGIGQRKLFKVLSNYSKYNKEIGYVQGMGYIAALFLIYMDERSSFYLLHSIIKNYELESIILPGFPGLKKKFYVLLNLEKKFVPKVYEILKRDEIFPSLYASEWFICLFSKDLKPSVLVRIFDTFLYEGYKVIYRFALAFLKMKENEFIRCKPGVMFTMDIVKELLCNIDVDILFKTAFNFHLSKKHIVKYEKEYEENKDNENNEFIKQL